MYRRLIMTLMPMAMSPRAREGEPLLHQTWKEVSLKLGLLPEMLALEEPALGRAYSAPGSSQRSGRNLSGSSKLWMLLWMACSCTHSQPATSFVHHEHIYCEASCLTASVRAFNHSITRNKRLHVLSDRQMGSRWMGTSSKLQLVNCLTSASAGRGGRERRHGGLPAGRQWCFWG